MSSVVIMMKISIYLCIILDGRHFLHHILHYSIKEGKSSPFLFFTRIVHCWRLQLTKLKTEINCWKRMASKHGLPSEILSLHTISPVWRGGDKANHPSQLSKGNVRVMCQLLMSPNERISTLLHRHLLGLSTTVNWLVIIYICCTERGG